MASRWEITETFAREYAEAARGEKGRMLDELVRATDWTRDHARRVLRSAKAREGAATDRKRTPRRRSYSHDAVVLLQEVWRLSGEPSGKYLAPVMDDTLSRLIRFGELGEVESHVIPDALDELRSMSAATIDRYLKPQKDAASPLGSSAAKPSQILRTSIPTRASVSRLLVAPGSLELDMIGHCGHTLKGEFLRTLISTDQAVGWTMLRTIRSNAYAHVHGALEWMLARTPVPAAGLDSDIGCELMNWRVAVWADDHGIPLTRSHHRNKDNAHGQPHSDEWVGNHAFRYRYETEAELTLLNELWELVMARKNHLLPCVKAVGWTYTKSGRKKRVYDAPRSPYQRLLETQVLDEEMAARLADEHESLNPAQITRRIDQIQQQLIALTPERTVGNRRAA
jgi:hypothetical protein